MQLLWIGNWESDEEFKKKANKGYDLASAQVAQTNLIYGIEKVSGIIFDSINGSVLMPYPNYKDRIIKPVEWCHKGDAFDVSVGYINDKYINRLNCKNSMIVAAKEWIRNRYKGEGLKIIIYSMRSAPMRTACYIKKRIPTAELYLVITDLPKFMDLRQTITKSILKSIDWCSIKKMKKEIDKFVLFSSKMAKYLSIPTHKWMLMEGSYDDSNIIMPAKERARSVMYSGRLDMRYGIPMLLEAFSSIEDQSIELWLTGSGNAVDLIQQFSAKDKRIKYFGFQVDRDKILNLQNKAALLINMRLPSEQASDYIFPSKLFEYMVTETPVLTFRLGGIPDEYYKYLLVIEDESALEIANCIKTAFSMTEQKRSEIGKKAKEFILNNKTATQQANRIWNFISKETIA